MEVLFVSHKFPPLTGGMEKQSFELITGMERKDCKVHRLVYEKQENKILFFLRLSKRIKKMCKENPNINIVHFNDGLLACYCSFFRLRENIVYTATLHGLDIVFPSTIYHQYIFKRLERYDCLVAVSQAAAQKTISLGIDPERVVVVPNGVDMPQIENADNQNFGEWLMQKGINPAGKKLLFMMGRAVKRKGFSWFSQNVFPFIQEHFMLIMAGPFRQQPCFIERVIYTFPKNFRNKLMLFLGYASDEREIRRALKNNSNVVHLGRLMTSEINQLLKNVDAFLMPNISVEGDMEGFGLVSLEASAQNALVLASNIDGIPDAIVHNKNGLMLPAGDVQAWTDLLRNLNKNPLSYVRRKKEFGHFTREHYSWAIMVDAYYALFTKKSCEKQK